MFRQKDPKPFPPVRGPSDPTQKQVLQGASASAPLTMAQELALLKQPWPKESIRCCGSAALNAMNLFAQIEAVQNDNYPCFLFLSQRVRLDRESLDSLIEAVVLL